MAVETDILSDIASLPPEARRQVADFVAFLKERYPTKARPRQTRPPLQKEPFVGMWRNRDDMEDSTGWVRRFRRGEWDDSQ